MKMLARRSAIPYVMLLPTLALIAVFMLYPMLDTVWLSFHEYSIMGGKKAFIGLENFSKLMKDPIFIKAVKHTIPCIVSVIFVCRHLPHLSFYCACIVNPKNFCSTNALGIFPAIT